MTTISSSQVKGFAYVIRILAFSAAIGAALNAFRKDSLPWNYQTVKERVASEVKAARESLEYVQTIKTKGEGVHQISLEDLVNLVDAKRVVILDSRPEVFHRLSHVPGALSFPRGEFTKVAETHRATLMNAAEQEIPIVIYCASATCKDAELVSSGLQDLGLPDHFIFKPGWAGWKSSGQQVESNLK